ncbi:Ubiquitin-conjugating enzyme E2 U [Sorochytrium milnesiophthora]
MPIHSRAALLLYRDLQQLEKTYVSEGISANLVYSNPFEWDVTLADFSDGPWAGGYFRLRLLFPEDYNDAPPQIVFTTVPYHPNVSVSGHPSLPQLTAPEWSRDYDLGEVLVMLRQTLLDPCLECAVNDDAADCFVRTPRLYYQIVRDVVVASQRVKAGLDPLAPADGETPQRAPYQAELVAAANARRAEHKLHVQQVKYDDYYHSWRNLATTMPDVTFARAKPVAATKHKQGRRTGSVVVARQPPAEEEPWPQAGVAPTAAAVAPPPAEAGDQRRAVDVCPVSPQRAHQVQSVLQHRNGDLVISARTPIENNLLVTVDKHTARRLVDRTRTLQYGSFPALPANASKSSSSARSRSVDGSSGKVTLCTSSTFARQRSPGPLEDYDLRVSARVPYSQHEAHAHPLTPTPTQVPADAQLVLLPPLRSDHHVVAADPGSLAQAQDDDAEEEDDALLTWSQSLPTFH